ncbi:MAG: LamG domain-containing protein, partial [Cyclobacteriaceae bacterium]
MKKITFILIGVIGFNWSCTERYIDDIELVEPGQDTEAPEVIVNFPVEGTQIRVTEEVTSIEIDIEVVDDIEIQTIVLELDGNEIARFDDFKDYRRALEVFEFDNVTNGEHTLEVTATDMAGKSTTTAVEFEKIEPYRPMYDDEIFYVPFDGDYTELVNIETPDISGSP